MPVIHRKPKWRVALVSNVKDKSLSPSPGLPPDAYAVFESIETVEGIVHEELILEILYLAAGRWGLLEPRELSSSKKKQV